MKNLTRISLLVAIAGVTACTVAPTSHNAVRAQGAVAAAGPSKNLLQTDDDFIKRLKPSSDQVTVARSTDPAAPGVVVTIQPGNDGYPGITLSPAEGDSWDLSAFGHLDLKVTNTGTKNMPVNLRVDDTGPWQSNPWNAENTYIQPGKTGTVNLIFGYSYGKKPGHKLKTNSVARILLFTGKSDVEQSFRIESLVAAGPAGEAPPVDPGSIRITPKDGFIVGPGAVIDAAKQLSGSNGGQGTLIAGDSRAVRAVFPPAKTYQSVSLKPAIGRWDLRDYTEVTVQLKNDGKSATTARVRLDTNLGPTDWGQVSAPIAPGAMASVTVPFSRLTTPDMGKKETLGRVSSDAVSGVTVSVDNAAEEQSVQVLNVRAAAPVAVLPDWLGKRPPVEGEWTQTLKEEFNGTTLDKTVWDNEGPNYYDKRTHWSKDSLLLGGGLLKLRYEKKTGFQNDDPAGKKTDYAAGYMTSYGKWVQRYGYFEARMKLPKAPGLWPAFWLMPDRGVQAGEQWRRQDTKKGGMEFDIMEHLTRWGTHRYTTVQHWDGYDKEHKSLGYDSIYVRADKDGYITTGLLWTPGLAVYYCNGIEVSRWEDPRISNVESCFLFTLPSGGWDNNPLDDKQLPADFEVDYVRVWQRKDLASDVDGKKAPAAAVATAAAPK